MIDRNTRVVIGWVSVNSSLSNAPRPGMGSGKELAQDSLNGAQVQNVFG